MASPLRTLLRRSAEQGARWAARRRPSNRPKGPERTAGAERFGDAAVVLGTTAVVLAGTVLGMQGKSETPAQTLLGWVLIAVGCGALYFRRRWPVTVAVVTLVVSAVYYPTSVYDGPLMIVFVVALYTAIVAGRFGAAVALSVLTMGAVVYGEARQDAGNRQIDEASMFMLGGWLLSILAIGRAQLTRTAYLHEAEQRALAAEREQEARAVQSATEERLRIAREVHDVLGHSISLINVQSSAALHRLTKHPGDPAQLVPAERALRAVKATSKDALRELRATLGTLRQVDEEAPTSPAAPGLDQLDELAERARAGGLDIRIRTEGGTDGTGGTGGPGEPGSPGGAPAGPLPPAVDLAAYRIVQESLTNVARHARARSALVTVERTDEDVRVVIDDDGRGAHGSRVPGSGIRGMTERAEALGGRLTAANTEHGFRIEARLPLERPAADERSERDR